MTDEYSIALIQPSELARLGIASQTYRGPCPACRIPTDVNLHYNMDDASFYMICPSCRKVFNTTTWEQLEGKKTTAFDIE